MRAALAGHVKVDDADPAVIKYSLTTDAETLDGFDATVTASATYEVNRATGALQQRVVVVPNPISIMGGQATIQGFETRLEYATIEPGLPPFLTRRASHARYTSPLAGDGEMDKDAVYSNYHRVQCDR